MRKADGTNHEKKLSDGTRTTCFFIIGKSWAPLRPSDSYFGQNWKPRTREIPLLFLNDTKVLELHES
jgi:hypothetical protein